MKPPRILISGAGIAGPALACALQPLGSETVVVERAPALRAGGQAVDFRGPVHRDVLERMEVWDAIHAHRTHASDVVLLGRSGRPVATLPAVMMSGDVEILRGDLSRLLQARSEASTDFRFGDHVTALEQTLHGVNVRFARAAPETFDLVVGADGLHSGIRALAFGPEKQFLRHHGYRVATCLLSSPLGLPWGACTYTVPGRAVSLTVEAPDRVRAVFIFTGGPLDSADRDLAGARRVLREAYQGIGWRVPEVLAELGRAPEVYLDQIGSISIDRYANGRVVLLGDAAYGGTLGGQGTPLALVGAHVLANELLAANGDYTVAFDRYEQHLRPYATRCQKGAERVGEFFAPRTAWGLWLRNLLYRVMTSRLLIKQFEKLVKADATSFVLPDYATAVPPPIIASARAVASTR